MALSDRDYMRDPTRARLGAKRAKKPMLDDIPIGSASWVGQPVKGAEMWMAAYEKAQRPPSPWRRFVMGRRYRAAFRKPMAASSWVALAVGSFMTVLPIANQVMNPGLAGAREAADHGSR